jgi:hypothetical protein
LLKVPVLCAGRARYTQYPIVFFPDSQQAYLEKTQEFLTAEEIEVPSEFIENARRFLYCQLFRSSLSFEDYLKDGYRKGYVQLRSFPWESLLPENSKIIQVLLAGINSLDIHQKTRLRTKEDDEVGPPFVDEEDG